MRNGDDGHDLFGEDWARAWCRVLNENATYREAGAGWEGPICLVLDPDPERGLPEQRSVWLDLSRGTCQGTRAREGEEPLDGGTVIGADPDTWRRILAGEIDPLFAIMSGKLQLRAGSLAELVPHARGAKELVASARDVPTRFPEGWEG